MKHYKSGQKFLMLLSVILSVAANAQDKILELKLDEKHRYLQNEFTDNGLSYFVTGNDKSSKTDLKIVSYDSDFNVLYTKNMESKYKGLPAFFGRGASDPQVFYKLYPTPEGKYAIAETDKLLLDNKGNAKNFDVFNDPDFKDFDSKFNIQSNDYSCYFGYKKVNGKIDKEANEPYIFRVNFVDVKHQLIPIKFPKVASMLKEEKKPKKPSDTQEWGISVHDDQQFYMINKMSTRDHREDQYNIAGFDYDGKLVKQLSILLKMQDKGFVLSDTGFGSKTVVSGNMVSVGLMDDAATGNIYADENSEFFYIYGLYSTDKIGNINKADYNGFYIHKYNSKGELIWKTEHEIVDKKGFNVTQRPFATNVSFIKIGKDQIGFRIYNFSEKYAHFFQLDAKEGKIAKNQKCDYKIESYRFYGVSGGAFATGYAVDKIYENKHFDINSLYAAFLNPKVDQFFKNSGREDLNYNCKINQNEIFLIEENTKKHSFRLLRFDL